MTHLHRDYQQDGGQEATQQFTTQRGEHVFSAAAASHSLLNCLYIFMNIYMVYIFNFVFALFVDIFC